MSDSSEDEDMSRFKEAVDDSFVFTDKSRGKTTNEPKQKSDRYVNEASHYNDVRVPEELQKQIGAKVSAIIKRNTEFVDVQNNGVKKRKIKGGVKLFRDSDDFMSCEDAKDTYTVIHNMESKRLQKKRRQIDDAQEYIDDNDKISAVVVTGDYILSKEETKCWKSRRKEKIFKYRSSGMSKVLTSID